MGRRALTYDAGNQISDPTQVVVTSSNTAAITLTNCAFWGPSNQNVKIDGTTAASSTDRRL